MKRKEIYMILGCLVLLLGFIFSEHYSLAKEYKQGLFIKDGEKVTEYENYNEIVNIEKENVYIDLDILNNHLNLLVDYDENNKIAVITSLDKVIRFYQEKEVTVNQQRTNNISPMMIIDGRPFVPINQIADLLSIKFNFSKDNSSVILESQLGKKMTAKAVKDYVNVRFEANTASMDNDLLKKDEEVEILKDETNWLKVITPRGKVGYVQRKELKDIEEMMNIQALNKPIWKPQNGKINLTWEYVYKKTAKPDTIGTLKGLNIVSPTWMKLKDASGNIDNKINNDYINWARNRGYKIWPLFKNCFDPNLTNKFLNDAIAREKAVNEVLKLIKENNMDGINIDFENVYLKDKEKLVLFVRELTAVFHENGLVVSIDVTAKGGSENWSQCYDREALGQVVDYVSLMAYDEHWSSSPVSGSVASIRWVEKGINGLLEEVPAEKLILGVPFYTRIWIETPSKDNPTKIVVKSKSVSMETVNEIIEKKGIEKVWDENSGQNYVEYIENDKLYKIWIEDAVSMKARVDLINRYNLAGIASWRRGFETEDIWDIIDENLNKQ
ncbi:glycosyl hydrolase family 18 protein [Crassaminicella indica]|uniref:SH3 domain-containing protein n=1 Tax=Crassaminicella indica TaxID=2855394 RepID=A0ABX8RC05_9CLOT|nr:glycosyl hydrolase family 18 protein [Crassaminicella indica]QXM06578.1 SH3 domain-containing protein [Crassaminicella indica]